MTSFFLGLVLTAWAAGDPPAEGPDQPTAPCALAANRARFYRKLAGLQWIAYTPSTFDPKSPGPVKREDIAADLKALIAQGLIPESAGICTYSCSPREGTDQIPRVARDLGFAGMIVGISSIGDRRETDAARRLAAEGQVDAIVMGNEGLESRYQWPELCQAMRTLRAQTQLPISTSEQIEDYGFPGLTSPTETDFVYPNVHPVFRGTVEIQEATDFVEKMINALKKRTQLPILVHETGWPSAGLPHHTPEAQRQFWSRLNELSKSKRYNIVIFEAFSQPWKHEIHQGADIGTSWGWFRADRTPKPVATLLGKHARQSSAAPWSGRLTWSAIRAIASVCNRAPLAK